MKICYIGKFTKMWDEEHIARSLESIGETVIRIEDRYKFMDILGIIKREKPDMVLFAKLKISDPAIFMAEMSRRGILTVCWVFDLYFGYEREYLVGKAPMFKADIVFTTDGGHQREFEIRNINHHVLRQGIYKPECVLIENKEKEHDVVFVGSHNPYNQRTESIEFVKDNFNLDWFGKKDADEVRGMELNELFSKTKVVIGDSVYSPYYWSNRVVETLGRGGFLIHVNVEGIKDEYPFLVTYEKGDYEDLRNKIQYYLTHDEERERIVQSNYDWVYNRYTCEHKCKELIAKCKEHLKI